MRAVICLALYVTLVSGATLGGRPTGGTKDGGGKVELRPPPEDDLKTGNITRSEIMKLNAQDLRQLDDPDLRSMITNLDIQKKASVCRMVMDEGDLTLFSRLDKNGLPCRMILQDDGGTFEVDGAMAEALMDQKRESEPMTSWDKSDWVEVFDTMGDALDSSDLKAIDPDVAAELVREKKIKPEQLERPDQKRAMGDQIKSAFGEADAWSSGDLRDLAEGDFLGSVVDPSDLRKMDTTDIRASLESFAKVDFEDEAKKEVVGRKIKQSLGGRDSADSWNEDDVKSAAQYVLKDSRVLKQLNENTLVNSLSNFTEHISSKRDGAAMGAKLKETTRYSDAKAMDTDKVKELGTAIVSMGGNYLKELPGSAVMDNLETIGQMEFSRGDAKKLAENVRGSIDFSTVSSDKIKDLGSLMTGMKKDDISAIPPSAMDEAVGSLAELEFEPAQGRSIIEKLQAVGGGEGLGTNADQLGNLINYAGASDLMKTSVREFGLNCDRENATNLEPTDKQVKLMAMKLKVEYGDVTTSNANFTAECFQKWGRIAAEGFDKEDFQNLREDDELPAIVEKLGEYEGDMKESQTKAIYEKIRNVLLTTDEHFKNMTDGQIEQVGKFFKHMNNTDLERFPNTTRYKVARKIGEADMSKTSRSEIQRLKRFALKNVMRDDTTMSEDRTSSGGLDDNDVRGLGNLKCGLEREDMEKLDTEAIENNVYDMGVSCSLDVDTGKALLRRAKEQISGLLNSSDTLVMVGGLLPYASDDDKREIPSDTLEEAFPDMSESLSKRSEKMEKRDMSYPGERDGGQRDMEKDNTMDMLREGVEVTIQGSQQSRKRRSTTGANGIECQHVQLMVDPAPLNVDNLTNMAGNEFDDCLETFGAASNWSSVQLDALVYKFYEVFGDMPSAWNDSDITRAGNVLAGLPAANLSQIQYSDEVIAAFGSIDAEQFTTDKIEAAYAAINDQTGMFSNTLNLNTTAIVTAGGLWCGAPKDILMEMSTAGFSDAITTLGSISCDANRTTALAYLARQAYGAPANWSSNTVAVVGNIVGGLTGEEIGNFTSNQIGALEADVISGLPINTLSMLSLEQIGYMADGQLTAFTDDQKHFLTNDVMSSLEQELQRIYNASHSEGSTTYAPGWQGGQSDMPGNMGGQSDMPGNMGGQTGMPGNMGGQTGMPGNMGGQTGMPGNMGGQTDMPGNMGGQTGIPGNMGGQTGMPGNMGGQTGMPDNMGGQTDMPGNMGGQTGMPDNMGGQTGMPGNIGGQTGMPGNVGGQTLAPGGGMPILPVNPIQDKLTSGNISVDDLSKLQPQDFRSMTVNELTDMFNGFDNAQKDETCKQVIDGGDTKLMEDMASAGLDCVAAIGRIGGDVDLGAGAANELLDQKMASKPTSQWNTDDWSSVLGSMADAIDPVDIKEISSNDMKSLIEQKSFSADDLERPDQKRAMSDQIVSAYGSADSWSAAEMSDLAEGDYLGKLIDLSDLRQMDAADIRSSLESFADVQYEDEAKRGMIGKKIKDGLGGRESAASWATADVQGAAQYILDDVGILDKLPEATVLASLKNFTNAITSRKSGMSLGKKLKTMSRFAAPANLTSADIKDLGSALPAMGKSYLEQLPTAAIVSNVGALGNMEFNTGDAREVMQKAKDSFNLDVADAEVISSLGNLMVGLTSSDMDTLPAASLDNSSVIAKMAALDFQPSQARAILKKLKTNNAGGGSSGSLGPNAKKLGKMIKMVALSELEGTSLSDFGLNCDATDTMTLEPDVEQAKTMVKTIKAQYGEMSATNTNYTSDCFSKWSQVAAMGFSKSDFENMRTDDELPAILEKLADQEMYMEEPETQAIYDKIRSSMLATDVQFQNMTEAKVEQIGVFLKHMNDSDLDKFPQALKPVVARKLGESNTMRMSKSEMTRLKKFALTNVLRDTSNAVTNRTAANSLDDNDIRNLGNLKCGLELSDMGKLSSDAIENNVFDMGKLCAFDTDTGRELLARAKSQISGLLNSSDTLTMSAGLLPYATDSDLAEISNSVWEESLSDVGEVITERQTQMKKRDEAFSGDRNTTQRDEESASTGKALKFGLDAVTGSASSKRRRRSTNSYTCSDISLMGDVTALTTSDISGLSTSTFEDCAETLGDTGDWSAEQLSALATQAKSAWGAVTNWNASDVTNAGSIVAGLTAAEIAQLTLNSDAISSIGAFDIFSADQLQRGYTKYLSDMSLISTNLTSDELMALGAFVCGATQANINDFPAAQYKDAAATVGTQTMCGTDQMQSFASLAKTSTVFGASSTWDSATVSTVGSMIGGLTNAELTALTETQLTSISVTDLALIPPAKFNAISATQINYLSVSQANAVTTEQEAALSSEAQAALSTKQGESATSTDNSGGNSAGALVASLTLMLASVFMTKL